MAQSTADVVALQLEAVKTTLPILYDINDVFFTLIQAREDLMMISSRAARLPIQDMPGSRWGYFNPAGGPMGRGAATHYDVPTVTALDSRIAIEINDDVLRQTNSEPQAIRNILSIEITNAMKEFRRQMNAQLQTSNDGVLATITAVSGQQLTVKTSPFYAQLLRTQQNINVYSSNLATQRTTTPLLISQIDEANAVVTIDASTTVPVTVVATDVILPEGLSGANPVAMNGLQNLLTDAQTGTWLTLNLANVPQVRASAYHAGSNQLTTYPIRLVLSKILQRTGMVNPKSLRAHMHPTQVDAYEQMAILVSQVQKTANASDAVDFFFTQKQMAGVEIVGDIHADRTRIDFVNLEYWGRVESNPIDFWKRPDGTYFERPFDTAGGSPLAAILFYIYWFGNVFTNNPSAQGFIDQLSVQSGYDAM